MTRINVGIKPAELPDKLLLAELREIKRVPNIINSGRFSLENIPEKFKLGTGHVKFFYNKLLYLKKRYLKLRAEAINRNFNVSDFSPAWDKCPDSLMNDYTPNIEDREILINRIINERGFKLL